MALGCSGGSLVLPVIMGQTPETGGRSLISTFSCDSLLLKEIFIEARRLCVGSIEVSYGGGIEGAILLLDCFWLKGMSACLTSNPGYYGGLSNVPTTEEWPAWLTSSR